MSCAITAFSSDPRAALANTSRASRGPLGDPLSRVYRFVLLVREAEVREILQEVVVRLEARGRDLAVAEPGESHAIDVVGGDAAVGVGGRPGAVVLEDVR